VSLVACSIQEKESKEEINRERRSHLATWTRTMFSGFHLHCNS